MNTLVSFFKPAGAHAAERLPDVVSCDINYTQLLQLDDAQKLTLQGIIYQEQSMSGLYPSLRLLEHFPSLPDDPSHPIQVALRTYSLSLSLSLGPSLLPFVLTRVFTRTNQLRKYDGRALLKVLRREIGYDGFAFAMTLAVGGGEALRRYWSSLVHGSADGSQRAGLKRSLLFRLRRMLRNLLSRLTSAQRTFFANLLSSFVGIILIQVGRYRTLRLRNNPPSIDAIPLTVSTPRSPLSSGGASPTLDLTLLLLVRAIDALIQVFVFKRSQTRRTLSQDVRFYAEPEIVRERLLREQQNRNRRKHQALTMRIDALVFWACSARIMWCFFYQPERLPRSYVKWIGSLANLDQRLLRALRSLRSGSWSYIHGSPTESHLLTSLAQDLGYPSTWGDPTALPAYGGKSSTAIWKSLGVVNRRGIGGLPCEVVHGGVGTRFRLDASCTANAAIRGTHAFAEAMAIYLPVHLLPVLLTRPKTLLQPHRAISILLGAVRSAAFLSTFVSSYWFTVCATRTLALARLLPFVSHDFWDGPYGCIMAGCLACGSSIWIENGRRRGEMALYVLPRAIRTCLPNSWFRTGNRGLSRLLERLVFIISFSCLLTAAIHKPDSFRGLSRWAVAFVLKGPNAGFWKRKRNDRNLPMTPSLPATPHPGMTEHDADRPSQSVDRA